MVDEVEKVEEEEVKEEKPLGRYLLMTKSSYSTGYRIEADSNSLQEIVAAGLKSSSRDYKDPLIVKLVKWEVTEGKE